MESGPVSRPGRGSAAGWGWISSRLSSRGLLVALRLALLLVAVRMIWEGLS